MQAPESRVASGRGYRVDLHTLRRRFAVLFGMSVALHLLLTPMGSWVGLIAALFPEREAAAPPPEELDAIPIELLDPGDESTREPAVEGDPELPEDDPIEVIDELIAPPAPSSPGAPTAEPSTQQPDAPKPAPEPEKPQPEQKPKPEKPERRLEDAGAGKPLDPEERAGDAGAPVAEGSAEPARQPREIDDPVALAGKAAKMVESNAKLSLILYSERIRNHPVGQRVGALLPRLPQWRDFFGDGKLDAVRDFDRFFIAGPSFYYSDQVVVVLQHNTKGDEVRQAIDRLVRRDGRWLEGTRVPAALAIADRAERLFVLPDEQLIMVVPPKLKEQALSARGLRIPRGRGEALVATISQPAKSFWQLGLDIPKTVHDAKIRMTALSEGRVKIELSAKEASEAAARSTAQQVSRSINAVVDGLRGLSGIMDWAGLGGLTRGAKLPRVNLRAEGKEIRGEVTLSQEQADFIIDRVESQVVRMQPMPTTPGQATQPNPPKPGPAKPKAAQPNPAQPSPAKPKRQAAPPSPKPPALP